MTKEERRKAARRDEARKVHFRILRPTGGEGYTQNYSDEGCCVVLSEEILPGSIIELLVGPPEDTEKRFRVVGKVVWQKNFLTGVRFLP